MLRTNAGRLAERERVVAAIKHRLTACSAAEWIARLGAAGVPCGVVRTVLEVLASSGGSALTGMPPSVPGAVRRAPPRLGEHSALVRERGWGTFSEGAS
jgi:crotonobetainyl-CoA:carnitine CoA-transferase CaiB-like acyl-CoA transferase